MKSITVMNPVIRLKGQMEVKISIDTIGGQHQIVDAYCTDTLLRGVETKLSGYNHFDAPIFTQGLCSIFPISHLQAAVLALESVSNWQPPTNARLLRNLILGAHFLQSHILHFYLLDTLDYVSIPMASPWTPIWKIDIRPGLSNVAANLQAALSARRHIHEMGAIFDDKAPGSNIFIPGGAKAIPTVQQIDIYRQHLSALIEFIESTYLPDVQLIGTAYSDYFQICIGCRNLLAFGAFEMEDADSSRLFRNGYTENGNPNVQPTVIASKEIRKSNNLEPTQGDIQPEYPGSEATSLPKAPDLAGKPYEGGPIARLWINGDYQRTISVMDRHVARALETAKIASAMWSWLDELTPGQNAHDGSFDQQSGYGVGLSEAPHGAIGHRLEISGGKISHYQIITPTCWNVSARRGHEVISPTEQALIGTVIQNSDQPIEALRIIHSYDPCWSS